MGKDRAACHLGFLPLLISILAAHAFSDAQLSYGFYAASFPSTEFIVRNTVQSARSNDHSFPGKLLRLLFHDCFVEGCDASVLLKENGTDQSDPANTSLGGFSVKDSAKRMLDLFCPGIVSCADIIALAARDAVEMTGGPDVQIVIGRRDGRVSPASNVRPNIADTAFSVDVMTKLFSSKGLSGNDLVTLSVNRLYDYVHYRCTYYRNCSLQCCQRSVQRRLPGRGNSYRPSLDKSYAEELIRQCLAGADLSAKVSNDPQTSLSFDNWYYKNLLLHKGLSQSDSALLDDDRTRNIVEEFAKSQDSFFLSWARSFGKLTSIQVRTGDAGEVRRSCSSING